MRRERILVFRPDNIGDVVLFSGALRHIRALFPDAHLNLAVQPHIVNLVELCPYVDTCLPVSRLTWWDRIKDAGIPFTSRFERIIRGVNRAWNSAFCSFDTILYPVKSPQVHHLQVVRELNARKVVGITGCIVNEPPGGSPKGLRPATLFTDQFDISAYEPWRHELLTTFDFLRYLGCPISSLDEIEPKFWLSDSEFDHLAEFRKEGRKIIGLFPGAADEMRSWEPGNFGEFAGLLRGNYSYAIFGSKAEKGLADRVVSAIRGASTGVSIINLTGVTTLRELVKTITSCDIFISMETAGLHIALAEGVPTIGIVGGGHYGRFVPWGNKGKSVFLSREMDCFYCNWLCSRERVECVQGVTPVEVADAAMKLLN
jgi:ADP-heptose:LPS heptosyltransferase